MCPLSPSAPPHSAGKEGGGEGGQTWLGAALAGMPAAGMNALPLRLFARRAARFTYTAVALSCILLLLSRWQTPANFAGDNSTQRLRAITQA